MVTWFEKISVLFDKQRSDGMASPESFGQGEGIWFDPKLLIPPPVATTAHPDLNFIKDQQDLMLATEFSKAPEEACFAWIDATLTLQWFD